MKALGHADGWTLCGAILSLVFALALIFSVRLQLFTDAVMAYVIAFWIILAGCIRIMAAVRLRRFKKAIGLEAPGMA